MAQKKPTVVSVPKPREKFYRILEHPLTPPDGFRGYQGELIEIEGDQVITRKLIDKPNLFEYAQTLVTYEMDPRNHVEPADPKDFA